MLVDFKPGANSIIGTEHVIRSAPDGYTFLVSTSSFVINAYVYKLPFDPMKDLLSVSGLIRDPFGLALGPALPVNNMKELIVDAQGYEHLSLTVPQFEEFLKSESSRWGTIVREAKIKLE